MVEKTFAPDALASKIVFITGGAAGILVGVAESCLQIGATVIVTSRKQEKIQKTADTLSTKYGGRCYGYELEVRDEASIAAAIDKAIEQFGRVDVLINGAAGNFLCPIEKLTKNGFNTVMGIDAMGTFLVSKCMYIKYFKVHGGVIINISAFLSLGGTAMQLHAGAAKCAIDGMTKHMAVEWGPSNVRVVGISPGHIADTEGFERLSVPNPILQGDEVTPLQRYGKKADIGAACAFMMSDAASFITGQTLIVDGGISMNFPNHVFSSKDFINQWRKPNL